MFDAPDVATSRRAAVIGSPIDHSLSPVLHNTGYAELGLDDYSYTRIECKQDSVAELINRLDESWVGLSVTMPCKFEALKVADTLTTRARRIGSANTLVRYHGGWRADNTDCDGVAGALEELGIVGSLTEERAVVVGGGGTARPALWALCSAGISDVTVINRTDKSDEWTAITDHFGCGLTHLAYDVDLSSATAGAAVIVSTVPSSVIAGREAEIAQAPVVDVIYYPRPTPLQQAAAANGHASVGGDVMLAHQAFSQFEQFTGLAAPQQAMRRALNDAL